MPRDRSRSPDHKRERSSRDDRDSKRRKRDRSRDRNDDDAEDSAKQTIGSLKEVGQQELTVDDYFLKAAEFKAWLREEKGKYLDDMSGESSRKYFKKFIKRWNDLILPAQYYRPQTSTSVAASAQTGYKWSFANNRSKVDKTELERLRTDVDKMTNGQGSSTSPKPTIGPSFPAAGRSIGPTMPMPFSANHADRQLAQESRQEDMARERKAERNKAYGHADEMVPKSGGREGKMEERKATNAENRMYREKDMAAGLDLDEATIMGSGGEFKQALAQREAANARRQDRRADVVNDRRSEMSERLSSMKAKDDETMAMFRQMAQSKFGGASR